MVKIDGGGPVVTMEIPRSGVKVCEGWDRGWGCRVRRWVEDKVWVWMHVRFCGSFIVAHNRKRPTSVLQAHNLLQVVKPRHKKYAASQDPQDALLSLQANAELFPANHCIAMWVQKLGYIRVMTTMCANKGGLLCPGELGTPAALLPL